MSVFQKYLFDYIYNYVKKNHYQRCNDLGFNVFKKDLIIRWKKWWKKVMEISYGKGPAKSYMYYQVFGSLYESLKNYKDLNDK